MESTETISIAEKAKALKLQKVKILKIDNHTWQGREKHPTKDMEGKEAYILGQFCEGYTDDFTPSIMPERFSDEHFDISDILETDQITWFYNCIVEDGRHATFHEDEIEIQSMVRRLKPIVS